MHLRRALLGVLLVLGTLAAGEPAARPVFEGCADDLELPVHEAGDEYMVEVDGDRVEEFWIDPTSSDDDRVTLSGELVWTNRLVDWDLVVHGVSSRGAQPLHDPVEFANKAVRGGCTLVTIEVTRESLPLPDVAVRLHVRVI